MDEQGKVYQEWFGRTVIHSDRRFTYEEAQKIIEGEKGDFEKEIHLLDSIAKKLREQRFKKGSIAFDSQEVKFNLNEKGEPTGIYIKKSKDANHLIEEFMLLANKRVAEFIGNPKNGQPKPFIYRIHDTPDPEKLRDFNNFIRKFGYSINATNVQQVAAPMNKLMQEVSEKPEGYIISQLAIRTMAKAVYSADNVGHFGLGFPFYSHFTSPIRRYPDIIAHRLLEHYLHGGKPVDEEKIEEKAKHSSDRERLAVEAERASIKFMQVKFLQDKIGERFEAMVSGLSETGIFVELTDSYCEGMVRLRSMDDDFYYYDEKMMAVRGRRLGKMYRFGDKIEVILKRADLLKKQIDFVMADDDFF